MGGQHRDPLSDEETNTRKRVCKACDRCRLKKSKCDGSSPCNRCQTDNQVCVFGERKKSHDKVYPKGYVEMLEQQQEKLVNAIRELYTRAVQSGSWTGPPLQSTPKGYPLTHDILERLGLLRLGPHDKAETFEENTEILRQRIITGENPYPTPDITHSDFSPVESPNYEPFTSRGFSDVLPRTPFQPTPPVSPEEQDSITFPTGSGVDTSMSMQSPSIPEATQAWIQTTSGYEYLAYNCAPPNNNYDLLQQKISPCLPMTFSYEDDLRDMGRV